ncbi:hypothetical protein CHS0354_000439 [Potamilus streckersoni]|uniref:RNA helicase n=1 Tax=Potamilus streckersoni TaxID=2493646 RepID=A0AAE0T6Y7_9BIVA|nr:hypothetical protein CHS0354_000439 [Potamilus streckersoni]
MAFKSLNIIDLILKAIKEEGYSKPTHIQEQAIPIILQGNDLLGCAQTGTGKTAAYAIPILQRLYETKSQEKKRKIRSLIVAPTRELVIQINDSFKAYGRHTGLSSVVLFGGVSQHSQVLSLRQGVDILIATSGRLLDLINQGHANLQHVEYFVLDEVDRMLDEGFIQDVKKIISKLPFKKQSLFFSATLPPEINEFVSSHLTNPSKVSVTPNSSTVSLIEQFVYYVDQENKIPLLIHLIKEKKINHALVFTRTKSGANKVEKFLLAEKIKTEVIHGNKSQLARQKALSNFKAQKTNVLIATDIAARGIDIDDLQHVFNFDIPNIAETYVHRIGRTGRSGNSGTAYAFCNAGEKSYIKDIEKLTKDKLIVIDEHPFPLKNFNAPKPNFRPRQFAQGTRREQNRFSSSGESRGERHNYFRKINENGDPKRFNSGEVKSITRKITLISGLSKEISQDPQKIIYLLGFQNAPIAFLVRATINSERAEPPKNLDSYHHLS